MARAGISTPTGTASVAGLTVVLGTAESDSTAAACGAATAAASAGATAVTVVATADLHRHHEDRYIDHDSKNLAEWFASDAPAHVDVVLFAGDLGLEMSAELSG